MNPFQNESLEILKKQLQNMEIIVKCNNCKTFNLVSYLTSLKNDPQVPPKDIQKQESLSELHEHSQQQVQLNKQYLAQSNQSQSNLNGLMTNENENKKVFIKVIVGKILHYGKLSEGTKQQYHHPLVDFLRNQSIINEFDFPTASNIIEYLMKESNASSVKINALLRKKKALHIRFSEEEKEIIQEITKSSKERIQKNCHQVWPLKLIQQFIDDLCKLKKGLTAFRIFMLYYLASRISELRQISFEMLIKEIKYIPQKQIKQGILSERKFTLPKEVVDVVKLFQRRNYILNEQSLDIGYKDHPINTHSYEKELQNAIDKIRKQFQNHKLQADYDYFLDSFKFHDLRYTKIYHMFKQGFDLSEIVNFIKHKNEQTTINYLTGGFHNHSIKINEPHQEDESSFILKIQFYGLRDIKNKLL